MKHVSSLPLRLLQFWILQRTLTDTDTDTEEYMNSKDTFIKSIMHARSKLKFECHSTHAGGSRRERKRGDLKEVTQTKPQTEMREDYQLQVEKEATFTEPRKGVQEGRSKHIGANQTPIFTRTRTINVARVREDDELKALTLMREIHQLEWKQHVQRLSSRPEAGLFSVTFKDTKAKEEISNQWESKVREGSLSYRLIMEEVQTDQIMKLDQLPEEVPTKAMEAYLSKYLIQPTITA